MKYTPAAIWMEQFAFTFQPPTHPTPTPNNPSLIYVSFVAY